MKLHLYKFLFALVFFGCTLLLNAQTEKIDFWSIQQKGTNFFNAHPSRTWLESAAQANIKFVRFTYAKWKGEKRDFLIGDADNFQGIVEADFQKLIKYISIADSLGIKVVITPISLPGARWSQNNMGKQDGRLWKDFKYQNEAILFWQELAARLKKYPNVVGYNIINEPHPEHFNKKYSFWKRDLIDWYKTIENTPADLNFFYNKIILAIREVDKKTPIILETGLYGTPWAFDYLKKFDDPNLIYSFHMYEPYNFTTFRINKNKFAYPGTIPIEEINAEFKLNKKGLKEFLNPVIEWTEKNNIPATQIWVGEFGCSRKIIGAEKYLADLIELFNEQNWHWSFYAFREDVWDDMDYELGTEKVNWKYWDYSENNSLPNHYNEIYLKVKNNPIWPVFEKEFKIIPQSK